MATDLMQRTRAEARTAVGRSRRFALAGLALALALGCTPFTRWLLPGTGTAPFVGWEILWWAAAGLLLLWLLRVERLPLSSIGIRWTGWRGVAVGIAAGIALIGIQILHFTVLIPALGLDPGRSLGTRATIMQMPIWFRLAMVVRAAVVEEVIFRGYLIEKGAHLTSRVALGVALSIIAFTYGRRTNMTLSRRAAVVGIAAVAASPAVARSKRDEAMYGLIGKMTAQAGKRELLASILIEGVAGMPGCLSYVVAADPENQDLLWITEAWQSKEAHAASLTLPSVRDAITKGRPLIAGMEAVVETSPIGGFGLKAPD